MNFRALPPLFFFVGLLSSCSSLKPEPTRGPVPTASRPEDVVAADAFFNANKGRGMIPDPATAPVLTPENAGMVVELDQQRVYCYCGDQLVSFSKLSSGRPNYRTETGSYVLGQKDLNHRSTLYGDYVNSKSGSLMMKDVTQGFDPRPVGAKFQGSLMKYFQRFKTSSGGSTAMGFHTGVLPGYPASHGCVRLPDGMAAWFFQHVPLGTQVIIRGDKLGVPAGSVQKRAKREPKIHSSLKKPVEPVTPVTPPAGTEVSPVTPVVPAEAPPATKSE